MLLITPDVLTQMLCPSEYKSFLADMLPSVPDRTRRNLKRGSSPTKKTIDKMISDLSSGSSLTEQEIRSVLSSQSPHPWKNAIAGLKKGMTKYYPPSFDYAAEIIVKIETAPLRIASSKQKKPHHWRKAAGLPSSILPDSFIKTCLTIGNKRKNNKEIPIESGKVLLRTNLFTLAALEASLIHSDLVPLGLGLWVHKMMPYYEESLIGPMREFFEVVMEKLAISSIANFAERLPSLTVPNSEKNIDSQKRQIQRWMSGTVPPSWETMRSISNLFFDGDDGPMVSYGVARFLQSLLNELRENYIPMLFENEKELVSIFQEYSKWQSLHREGFARWNEARSKEPLASPQPVD